jgi:nitroimidazol reductase NimA-like FMN-containing flavoprotein (pyridoxamine 5'-phosphate oxidase superfamily)
MLAAATEGDEVSEGADPAARDHAGLEVMSRAECDARLHETPLGRVAFVADGDVVVFPVNFRYHEGTVVFRTSEGAKLEAAAGRYPVAFEIDGWDAETEDGWSVLVKGVAQIVEDDDRMAELFDLGLRPWADALDRRRWVQIRPDEITGRKTT